MKRCPRCGEQVPEEMQFCLHCMERFDAPNEIPSVAIYPKRKWIVLFAVVLLWLLSVGIFLFLRGKNKPEIPFEETLHIETTTSTTADTSENGSATTSTISENAQTSESLSVSASAQTAAFSDVDTIPSASSTGTEPTSVTAPEQTPALTTSLTTTRTTTLTTTTVTAAPDAPFSLEQLIKERFHQWSGHTIVEDSFVFNDNSCSFTAMLGGNPVQFSLNATETESLLQCDLGEVRAATGQIASVANEVHFLVFGDNDAVDVSALNTAFRQIGETVVSQSFSYEWSITAESARQFTITCRRL